MNASAHFSTAPPGSKRGEGFPANEQLPTPTGLSSIDDPMEPLPLPSTMWFCLIGICVAGIGLNIGMLVRQRVTTVRSNKNRHSTRAIPTAIAIQRRNSMLLLAFMAAADTISLVALLLALSTQYLPASLMRNEWLLNALCKLDLYLIHSASAFSLWCWTLLSGVRYMAIHHPYRHLRFRMRSEPLTMAALLAVACCVLEAWILYDIVYVAELQSCGEALSEGWSRGLQLVEITWTYFLPLAFITVLDSRVLCCLNHDAGWEEDVGMTEQGMVRNVTTSSLQNSGKRSEVLLSLRTPHGLVPTTRWSFTTPSKALAGRTATALNGTTTADEDSCGGGSGKARTLGTIGSCVELRDSTNRTRIDTGFSATDSLGAVSSETYTWVRVPGGQQPSQLRVRRRTQQLRMLRRYLIISVLDLGMNLPNYLLRLYLTLVPEGDLEEIATFGGDSAFLLLHDISQLLYFAQFSLNALYLVGIIYVAPASGGKKKPQKERRSYGRERINALAKLFSPYKSYFPLANWWIRRVERNPTPTLGNA